MIISNGPKNVPEISEELGKNGPIYRQSINRSLEILRECGLINKSYSVDNKALYYSLNFKKLTIDISTMELNVREKWYKILYLHNRLANLDKIVELEIWGVGDKSVKQLNNVNIDDILLIYIKSGKYNGERMDSSIFGIFKVASEIWKEENNIFINEETSRKDIYPNRIRIQKVIKCKKTKKF